MTMNKVKAYASGALWLVVLFLPSVVQVCFNFSACSSAWYVYWPLILLTSCVPIAWLLFGRKFSALIAVLVQLLVLSWFNWQRCGLGYSSESAFVGGLGSLYAVTLAVVGGLLLGLFTAWATRFFK
jgi:hypothetical protein